MIGYLLWIRMKGFFTGLRNPWKIVLHLVLLLTVYAYGRLFAHVINKAGNGEIETFSPEKMISVIWVLIAGFTIVKMFFPTYTPIRQIFPKYLPVPKFQRYLLSVVTELTTSYFFYLFLFLLFGCWYLDYSKYWFLYSCLTALITSILFKRILQYFIDFRLKRYSLIMLGITAILILTLFYIGNFLLLSFGYLCGLLPLLLFLIGFKLDCQIIESKKIDLQPITKNANVYLKLLINNRQARLLLLVGILFKSLLLIGDYGLFKGKGKHLFDGQIIYWMFASPLILFTYVFNNIWGFWTNVWMNVELRSGKSKHLINFTLKLLLLPLIIDAFITLPILLFTWDNHQFILLFYAVSLIFLVCSSFLWSILFPITINSYFQMKGSSSFVSSLSAMVSVIALSLIKINYWFYILIPLFLLFSFAGYRLALDVYKEKKYQIYKKLNKGY